MKYHSISKRISGLPVAVQGPPVPVQVLYLYSTCMVEIELTLLAVGKLMLKMQKELDTVR